MVVLGLHRQRWWGVKRQALIFACGLAASSLGSRRGPDRAEPRKMQGPRTKNGRNFKLAIFYPPPSEIGWGLLLAVLADWEREMSLPETWLQGQNAATFHMGI